jgi:hypothetical protein
LKTSGEEKRSGTSPQPAGLPIALLEPGLDDRFGLTQSDKVIIQAGLNGGKGPVLLGPSAGAALAEPDVANWVGVSLPFGGGTANKGEGALL